MSADPAPASAGFDALFRVRFDEAGPGGLVRTSSLLRYAQDLAWQHSDARGFDRAWYAGRGVTWLVRAAELGVTGRMASGDTLTGTTEVVGFRRVWSRRRTTFRDRSGAEMAWVHIDWVLVDERGVPQRIPPDIQAGFAVGVASFSLARVELIEPPADAVTARIGVRLQELDPLDHVNNAVYADWLDEQVAAAAAEGEAATRAVPRRVGLEYARAAERGATVIATTWRDPGDAGWSCRLDGEDGTPLLRARLLPGVG
ncbi:MAG TPA: acyl-ACP thioesterase domain-containing protein [Candidatus Limnocylindrales bacterium]|nr:acyl-ACP thioesterase domain-containing protein [Candidatus Limnocylindrales bacterium]